MSGVICKICSQIVDTDYNVEHGSQMHGEDCPNCAGRGLEPKWYEAGEQMFNNEQNCSICFGTGVVEPDWM